MDMDSVQSFLSTTLTELGVKILAAIAFWIVGRWLIGKVISLVQAGMNRNNVDPTLTKYLGSIVAVALNIALVLGILGYFGIQTTSFAAMLAGAAWSGLVGAVDELGLFGATIITPDIVQALVGNSKVFGDTVLNFLARPARRVERTAQLAGGVDALDAIARFKAAVAKIPNVVTAPAPEVNLLDINLVGTVIAVRPYCHTDHYWQVYFATNEMMVRVDQEAGWPAPTPTPTQIMKTVAG